MREYILVTAAWVMIFICGCVVGVIIGSTIEPPVGRGVEQVEKRVSLFDPNMKKGVENPVWR